MTKKEDLDNAIMSNLLVLEKNIEKIELNLKGINRKDLNKIEDEIEDISNKVLHVLEEEFPKYKKSLKSNEIFIRDKFYEHSTQVDEKLDKFNYFIENSFEKIEQNQKVQGHLLNEVKTKVPENAKLVSGGSGFLIDTKGFVITNAHVLKGEGAIVVNSLGQEFKATIVYSDKNSDLALLKIEDEDYKQAKALPFTIRKKSSDLGEDIFTLGFPRNDNDIVYGKGYLSAQTGFNGDSNTYQIQISANPGYSGAPVFNEKNELIGIMSSRQKLAEGVAFAIKSDKLFDLVETLEENELTKDLNVKLNKQKVKGAKNRKAQINNFKNYIYSVRAFN